MEKDANGTQGTGTEYYAEEGAGRRTRLEMRAAFRNLKKVAAELGCSDYHLRAVLTGRRRAGKELAARLKERGIRTRKMRPAAERWV